MVMPVLEGGDEFYRWQQTVPQIGEGQVVELRLPPGAEGPGRTVRTVGYVAIAPTVEQAS